MAYEITKECNICNKQMFFKVFDEEKVIIDEGEDEKKHWQKVNHRAKFRAKYFCDDCSKKYEVRIVKKPRKKTQYEKNELLFYEILSWIYHLTLLVFCAWLLYKAFESRDAGNKVNWWLLGGSFVLHILSFLWKLRIERIKKETSYCNCNE